MVEAGWVPTPPATSGGAAAGRPLWTASTVLAAEPARALPGAAGRGELEVHFQPEVELASGEVTGLEALLRWFRPGHGVLWPGDFMPLVDALGLTREVGDHVLGMCATAARRWAAFGAPAGEGRVPLVRTVWVTVSARQVLEVDFAERLAARVAGLPAGSVGLDLPTALLDGAGASAVPWMRTLRDAGVRLSLGGVGGPADAAVAVGLPIQVVTLARPLVRGIDTDARRAAVLRAVVGAAHAAGRSVRAGGVESWAEVRVLVDAGVARAQGFLFGGPQRADRVGWLLAQASDGWRGSYLADTLELSGRPVALPV